MVGAKLLEVRLIPDRMTPEHMARLMELVLLFGDLAILIASNHMAVSVELVRGWIDAAESFGLQAWCDGCASTEITIMAGVVQ